MRITSQRTSTQQGTTLIEVLVATLIVAVGVLGAASLQINAVKFNHLANVRSYATILAYDLIDRMRANRARAQNGGYDLALDASAPTGSSINEVDLREWLAEVERRLPDGDGSVSRNGSIYTVTLQWDEGRASATREEGSSNLQQFSFQAEL